MSFIKALFTLFFLVLLQGISSALDTGSNSNIAVYWGKFYTLPLYRSMLASF